MFKFLGLLVGLYTLYALTTGEVHAKAGIRWKVVVRTESPGYYWTIIVIYGGLAIALATVF